MNTTPPSPDENDSAPEPDSQSFTQTISEPFEMDGAMTVAILSRFSDGFVCLRFDEAIDTAQERLPSPPEDLEF